jgi:hypothetical protein
MLFKEITAVYSNNHTEPIDKKNTTLSIKIAETHNYQETLKRNSYRLYLFPVRVLGKQHTVERRFGI